MPRMVALESSKLFSSLAPAELKVLQHAAQVQSFPAAEIIFKEGDAGNGVYVVGDGLVQISAIVHQEERRVLSRIGPGDFFGEMAVLDSGPRSATATAEVITQVYFVPQSDLLQILERSPEMARTLVRRISQRMREFNRQYIQEVLQAERLTLVGRFARSIVHDFKNPLTVIGMAADLIAADTAIPEARLKAKQRIRKQVDRLSNMINELLEFTRGSQTSIVLAKTNYRTFIEQLRDDLQAEAEAKSVRLIYDSEPPDVVLLLEPQRMIHVFYNLVHNAMDAMPEGGKIYLRFSTDENQLTTEIEDTGKGVAPEIAPRLFEPFATFGKAQGTGLGLSICRRIVQDHRGQIRVRNEPGRGAIFVITLPLPATH
jgi:signal transduction histidine kinase